MGHTLERGQWISPDDGKHPLTPGKANWRVFSESGFWRGALQVLKPEPGLPAGLLLLSAWGGKVHGKIRPMFGSWMRPEHTWGEGLELTLLLPARKGSLQLHAIPEGCGRASLLGINCPQCLVSPDNCNKALPYSYC